MMAEPTIMPYGSWKSPITSDLIVSEVVGLTQPAIDGSEIYWIEMRPSEGGRNVITRRSATGLLSDVIPAPFNSRTRVHEYGGGDYAVRGGSVYFSNFANQQIYLQSGISAPQPVTAGTTPVGGMRYSDYVFDQRINRVICVREDHCEGQINPRGEPSNTIVSFEPGKTERDCGQVIVSGNDFYSSPRPSPDGSLLAWLTWNHPNMPWDGTELWLGELQADGTLREVRRVAGGLSESIFQPEWSPDGTLYFATDRSGWWNLSRVNATGKVERVCEMEAEFGMPQWVFGMSLYAFESPQRIVCSFIERGISNLALIDSPTGKLTRIDSPYTDIQYLRASSNQAIFRGGSPSKPASIVRLDFSNMRFEVLRRSMNVEIDDGYVSTPEAVEFPTEGGQTAHGLFYAPQNRDYRAAEEERPPLLVKSHGGPTAAATAALSLTIQYFTSRGIAVLDVKGPVISGSVMLKRWQRTRTSLNRVISTG